MTKKNILPTTEHTLFPGIKLFYYNKNFPPHPTITLPSSTLVNTLLLCYCKEGNMEYHLRNEFFPLTPGDLLVAQSDYLFPDLDPSQPHLLAPCQGIIILLNLAEAPSCFSCFLEDVEVRPDDLVRKFCLEKGGSVLHANSSLEHIFSDWDSIPSQIQKGFFKVKILELLLFLSAIPFHSDKAKPDSMTKSQIELTQRVCQYLTDHMEKHITLEQLSEQFHVSGTYIRTSFKTVYGTSLYSFIRTQKMKSAASMLEYTDKSILEIAGSHGYDNGSKFASAFRSVIGMAPNEYRNRCCRKRIY